jgi:hypothetical protein
MNPHVRGCKRVPACGVERDKPRMRILGSCFQIGDGGESGEQFVAAGTSPPPTAANALPTSSFVPHSAPFVIGA